MKSKTHGIFGLVLFFTGVVLGVVGSHKHSKHMLVAAIGTTSVAVFLPKKI